MSKIIFNVGAAPGASAEDKVAMYAKTNDKVYTKDDAGVEHVLSQDGFGIEMIVGDGILALVAGVVGYLEIPFDCTISSVRMFSKETDTVVVDIWKDTFAHFPPTDVDSITSATPPTITAGKSYEDVSLSGWTITFTAGDILAYNIDTVTVSTQITISLRGKKV